MWAEWLIPVWPPLFLFFCIFCVFLGRWVLLWSVTTTAQSHEIRENTLPLTLHPGLNGRNIDIPPQILRWQLLLLSKVKLIRSFQPTGCCLVHISTAWSPAQVHYSCFAIWIKKIHFYSASRLHKLTSCSSQGEFVFECIQNCECGWKQLYVLRATYWRVYTVIYPTLPIKWHDACFPLKKSLITDEKDVIMKK